MRNSSYMSLAGILALGVAACASSPAPASEPAVTATSPNIVAAIADAARPSADKERDANRKPADMLAFAEVREGDVVGELIPGGGYFSRILSKAVGPTGKLIAFNGPPREGQPPALNALTQDAANYANVSVVTTDFVTLTSPQPLDLVWTTQNYHDLHNPGRNMDLVAANKQIFDALKPGGLYIVLDHSAVAGTGVNAQLHRMEPHIVKEEVIAAGFELVGESDAIRNPADPRDKSVFDPSIRGSTDQFLLKFKKPG